MKLYNKIKYWFKNIAYVAAFLAVYYFVSSYITTLVLICCCELNHELQNLAFLNIVFYVISHFIPFLIYGFYLLCVLNICIYARQLLNLYRNQEYNNAPFFFKLQLAVCLSLVLFSCLPYFSIIPVMFHLFCGNFIINLVLSLELLFFKKDTILTKAVNVVLNFLSLSINLENQKDEISSSLFEKSLGLIMGLTRYIPVSTLGSVFSYYNQNNVRF